MAEPQGSFFTYKQDTQRTALIGVCISVVFLFGIIFLYAKTGAVTRDALALRQQLVSINQVFNQLAALQAQSQKAKVLEQRFNAIFPDNESVLQITSQLDQLARKNKVQQTFSFGAEYAGDAHTPKDIGFNLIAQSSLSDFVRYIQLIEQSPFFLDFGAIEISKTDSGYQANTAGRIYTR